jgi:uncharacterized protein (DUF1330 family)
VSEATPTAEQLAALSRWPKHEPLVMINLLAFKRPAGAQSYARYAGEVQPHLQRAGAQVLYLGQERQMVVGAAEHAWWDAVIVVEYPSVDAFLTMVGDPDYQLAHRHREAALERAELIATASGMSEH